MNIYHDSTKNIDTNLDAESFINICKDNKSILVQVKLCTINIASDAKNQNIVSRNIYIIVNLVQINHDE